MIEVKVLEIRDSCTYIGALAIKMTSSDPAQTCHLRSAGYAPDGSTIILVRLNDGTSSNSPFGWPTLARTMCEAHKFIEKNFEGLVNGSVVDVQFILGETKSPKSSEVHL